MSAPTLRPYQDRGLNEIRAALMPKEKGGGGFSAPLFVLPTGGGKTVTYAAMARGASAKGNNILILEHRKELLRQASCAVGSLDVRHRIIAPPDKVAEIRRSHVERIGWPMVDNSSNVAVASVQTLARRMDWLQLFRPRIIIIDEAHHAVAGTWARVIEACPQAALIGVTATPCRTDGQGLSDVFDCMIEGPTMRELIDDGYLVPPRVFAPPVRVNLDGVHHKGGDFDAQELADLLDTPTVTGDAVEHYSKITPGRPAIVFCASVKHAEHVAETFRSAGWRFEVVTGDMDDGLRDSRISGLADGRLQGIVSVDVLSEGTDVPAAEVAILLRATESEGLYLQQVGRVLRTAPGKEFGYVLDHVGNTLRHGMPDADRDWTLEGRKRRGRGAANDNEPKIRVVQCPRCYAAQTPAPTCCNCGHVFDTQLIMPEQRAGELQEITSETIAAQQARKAQGKARTLEQLKAMGMSDGRAAHVMAAREEKERLQQELRTLAEQWGGEYPVDSIRDLKPKALREEIERLRSELGHVEFMGEAATA